MTLAIIRKMYVFDGMSTAVIARLAGMSKRSIRIRLIAMGISLRTKTSLRTCRIEGCGKPAWKRKVRNGKQVCLSGGMCFEHTRENWQRKNLARRFKAMYSKTQEPQQAEPKPINGYAEA